MSRKSAILGAIVLLNLVLTTAAYCESSGKSHQECLKRLPSSWGRNFGEEWRKNEAAYWACRLGVATETVQVWQTAADVRGMIQDLLPATIDNQSVVLVEEIQGTAGCHFFKALRQTDGVWHEVWRLPQGKTEPPMRYCTLACPAIRMRVYDEELILEVPGTSDPNEDVTLSCKHVVWQKERYQWNGRAFDKLLILPLMEESP